VIAGGAIELSWPFDGWMRPSGLRRARSRLQDRDLADLPFDALLQGANLVLLSDGFPARDVLSSMVHLVRAPRTITDAPIYHWGDIDVGGVRIAAHLEDAFGIPGVVA